ncbi:hypothetical protein [Peribacillus muralis]|uniref:hypothetical protein n=1 Tax=Peribacillus muralis TaxID=264697 RepID=UPI00366ACD60
MEKITCFSFQTVIYALLTLLFLMLSLVLYQRRKLEHVSQAFVFPKISPLFKFGLTICMLLFSGFYFSETTGEIGWIFFGYAIGSLFGYYLGEIILQKTWRTKFNLKVYLFFTMVIIALALILKIDLIQYKTNIPNESEVRQIYIGNTPSFFEADTSYTGPTFLKQKENIEAVMLLHQQIIEKGKTISVGEKNGGQSVFIMYQLKDGKRVAREYHLQNYESYLPLLAKIHESSEYKKTVNELLHVDR